MILSLPHVLCLVEASFFGKQYQSEKRKTSCKKALQCHEVLKELCIPHSPIGPCLLCQHLVNTSWTGNSQNSRSFQLLPVLVLECILLINNPSPFAKSTFENAVQRKKGM